MPSKYCPHYVILRSVSDEGSYAVTEVCVKDPSPSAQDDRGRLRMTETKEVNYVILRSVSDEGTYAVTGVRKKDPSPSAQDDRDEGT